MTGPVRSAGARPRAPPLRVGAGAARHRACGSRRGLAQHAERLDLGRGRRQHAAQRDRLAGDRARRLHPRPAPGCAAAGHRHDRHHSLMTSKNTLLLGVAAAVVAIAAFYFLALSPKRDEIAKLDADIATKATELEQARMTLSTYEQARGTYKENYATLVRIGKAVPADDDVRSLLVQLEATADRSDVDFQKIEVGSGSAPATGETTAAAGELAKAPGTVEIAGGALSAMPFNLTFNGGYFELQTFLARLERFVTPHNERLDATGR